MRYSVSDLEKMLSDLESDLTERKESFRGDAPNSVRETVCAFANDLPNHRLPGVIFIGVRDDGTSAGLPITDQLLLSLADVKTDGNIVPPPTLIVEKQKLSGFDLAVLTVLPSDSPPVRFKGRVHIRIGPRRGIASAQDERVLNEKRRHHDQPFDVRPIPSSSIKDLDRRSFEEEYLPAAFAPDIIEANNRTYEQRLAATKMLVTAENPVPTVLGMLVLGTKTRDFLQGAYIQFLRISGKELSDPITDELLIEGPIAKVIQRIDEKLEAHNRTAVDFTSGSKEKRKSVYPTPALQQIIRNAVMHRSYEATNSPIRVTWFDDRLEIMNPGGPYGSVTTQNFGQPGITDYRNPNIAEALRVIGFVQRFGLGIATARKTLTANGNPEPDFAVTTTHICVTLRPAV